MLHATAAAVVIGIAALAACHRASSTESEAPAQDAVRKIDTADKALDCAARALGDSGTLRQVSTLSVAIESRPGPQITGGVPSTGQITIALPRQFKRVLRSERPMGRAPAIRIDGFSDDLQFQGYTTPDGDLVSMTGSRESLQRTQHDAARFALAWLLRSTGSVPLDFSHRGYEVVAGTRHAVVRAAGSDGFDATLYFRETDCVLAALSFRRPTGPGDSLRDRAVGRTSTSNIRTEFLYLSGHQRFASILFPTAMRREVDDVVTALVTVTDITVNPARPASSFSLDKSALQN
jgi:hypothetical protein